MRSIRVLLLTGLLLALAACQMAGPPQQRGYPYVNQQGEGALRPVPSIFLPPIVDQPAGTACPLAKVAAVEGVMGEPLPVTMGGASDSVVICRYAPADRLAQFQTMVVRFTTSNEATSYFLSQQAERKAQTGANTTFSQTNFFANDAFMRCGPQEIIVGYHKRDVFAEMLIAYRAGKLAQCDDQLRHLVEDVVAFT